MSNVTCQINHLLEKMTSSDKDYRFMATNDLMTELQRDNIKLDDESEKKVMLMLLHQLKDQNSEVQNLAIKCLGFLIHKVKDNQIKYIINTLCTNLLSDNEQLRDISSVGLKTVISEFPLASSTQTANICQRIVGVLSNSIDKQDVSIQLEILDILADLLSRFGSYLVSYDNIIITSLLPLLRSPRQAIRKRTIVALSHLALFCNPELYEKLINYLSAELVSTSQVSLVLTIIQCIVAVCRQAGHRFGDYVDRIVSLINNNTYCENDEIREHCLQGFEVFIAKCPKEISQHIGKIIDLCLQLISYDPNYNHDHDEENGSMQIEDEEEDSEESNEYSDEEDMSWKIRRSAAKCLEAAILTRHELLPDFYKTVSPILIARFKEREESVKSDIFHAYIALLKQTKASIIALNLENMEQNDMPTVLLQDQVPLIMEALQSQIKDKSIRTRQDCFNLLKELVSILPGCLSNHMDILISGVQYSLGDKNSNINMKINTLSFIHHLLTNHSPEVFHPHMDMLITPIVAAVNDSFYKISAEALMVLQQLIVVLRPFNSESTFDFTIYVDDVYACTFMRLKSSAIDQEVKERAISCMGQIISVLGDYLLEKNSVCLPIFLDRLKNEITRLTTVRALKMIAASPLNIELFIINDAIPILGSFLHKNQRVLKLLTLSLLDTLVQNYSSAIDTSLLCNLVNEVPPLLNESDLHIAQLTMTFLTSTAEHHSAALINVKELIFPEIIYLVKSPLLQNTALESMTKFFQALINSKIVSLGQQDILKMLMKLVDNDGSSQMLHKQVYHSLAKCVAAVAVVSNGEALFIVEQFLSDIIHNKYDAKNVFALLAIGEIGRFIDLSSLEQLQIVILDSLSQNSEEVKLAASYALGNVAIGNLPHYLPFVLEAIENQPKKQYLLLHSLKEIINNHSTTTEEIEKLLPFVPIIWTVLFKHCECNEEGTRNIVSECLGKLTLIDPTNLLPHLQDSLSSTSPLMRATVITAVKFTISDQPQPIDQLLLKCMGQFLNMLNDVDLNVCRVTLLTFNSAAHNKAFLIRNLLDMILPNLYNATKINRELIREIEMGPFKHTVDDGLDLRKAAFECMNTLLDSCLDKLDIFEFLNHLECGMRDHYDIKILTYLMAARVAQLCPNAVLQRIERLIEPLRTTFTIKLKSDAVKQEYEKQDELRRSAMRTVATWLSIPDADKNPRLSDFISHIKSTVELNKIFESVQKDISGRMDCFTLEQNFNI